MGIDQGAQELERLRELRDRRTRVREELAREEADAVRAARLAGATWLAVGKALGVSAQAVQSRYPSAFRGPWY